MIFWALISEPGMALNFFILDPGKHMSCQIGVPGIFGVFQKKNVYKERQTSGK